MKFSGKVGNGPMNEQMFKSWWQSRLQIPDHDTGKTCLGGG